jgi:hypothetical protein
MTMKRWIIGTVAFAFALYLAQSILWNPHTAEAQVKRGAQGWEYKEFGVYMDRDGNVTEWYEDGKQITKGESRVAKLNEYGRKGWELVATPTFIQSFGMSLGFGSGSGVGTNTGGVRYYFKRPM